MIGRIGAERSKEEIDSARKSWAQNHDNEQICGVIDRCQCTENVNASQTLICREDDEFTFGTRCICAPSEDPNAQDLIELASNQGARFEDNAARSASAVFVGGTAFLSHDGAEDEDAVLLQFDEIYATGHLKLMKKTLFGTGEKDRLEAVVLDREGVLYGAGTTRGGMATCITEITTSVVDPDGPKTNCGGSDVFVSIWQPTNGTEDGYVEMHSLLQLGSDSDESVRAIEIVGGFHELVRIVILLSSRERCDLTSKSARIPQLCSLMITSFNTHTHTTTTTTTTTILGECK